MDLVGIWYWAINLYLTLKMTGVWDIAPCSLVEVDRRFRGAYCLHHRGALSSNTVISIIIIIT
jgi:hypothetical protein